ncbi:hypothetical protein HanHA300_Chr11g0386001 [Helianthus annuus]|nr:hypothetical protein HanHA300_Chr11g0386001 [Helianthus annuus]KAJ0507445.1 hypothetical protein HanIR_Chr11g0506311 [Helianthus annuus]KAJ0515947.1 hypothetical protein HanHA89_Chr11g0408411 [Helianthus annuus]
MNVKNYLVVFVAIGTSHCRVFFISPLISGTVSCNRKQKHFITCKENGKSMMMHV